MQRQIEAFGCEIYIWNCVFDEARIPSERWHLTLGFDLRRQWRFSDVEMNSVEAE